MLKWQKNIYTPSLKFVVYKFIFLLQFCSCFFYKRKFNDQNFKKIGIFLQWGIGDALIAHPLISHVVKKYPSATIYLIGKNFNHELYSDDYNFLKYINFVPPWTQKSNKYLPSKYIEFFKKIAEIKKNNFDLLISPRFDFRDNLQISLIRPNQSISYSYNSSLKQHRLNYSNYLKTNEYQLMESFIKPLNISEYKRIYLEKIKNDQVMLFLKKNKIHENNFIVFQGGASDPIKNITVKCSASILINIFKHQTVVLIKDPSYCFESFINLFNKNEIHTLTWEGSLKDVKSLIASSKLFVGADSGLLHLAYALKIDCLGFYINNKKLKKWSPPGINTYLQKYKNINNIRTKQDEASLIKKIINKDVSQSK